MVPLKERVINDIFRLINIISILKPPIITDMIVDNDFWWCITFIFFAHSKEIFNK